MAEWHDAGAARRELAEVIEALEPAQLDAGTPCGHWTPRHILGHAVSFVDIGLGGFVANLARHRFDYDRAADTLATRFAERPVDDLVATLRAKATKSAWLPMFPEAMTVADVVVHTQDVRRSAGIEDRPSDDTLRAVLDFLTTNKMASNLGGPKLDGLALSTTDLDWSWGSGPEVRGPAESLMMALTGREVLDELTGDGVDRLNT